MRTPSQEQITLLTNYDPASAYTRAYQTLYTNIRLHWDHDKTKYYTIQFTTPAAYRGQAIVAANIAVTAAQQGTPVVLVDADLSAPSIQHHFALADKLGLSDLLVQETLTQQSISAYLHKTSIPDLYVLGTGQKALTPTKESERLFTTTLPVLLVSIREHLAATENLPALILFHGPPVLADDTHAIQIGSVADQTFLTIVSGLTTRTQATRAWELLQQAKVPVAGTIMVDV